MLSQFCQKHYLLLQNQQQHLNLSSRGSDIPLQNLVALIKCELSLRLFHVCDYVVWKLAVMNTLVMKGRK